MAHPDEDCEDCGVLHTPWSLHEWHRREDEREIEEHGDVGRTRFTRLHSLTPEGTPLYVEVAEPGMLPLADDEDPFAGGDPF